MQFVMDPHHQHHHHPPPPLPGQAAQASPPQAATGGGGAAPPPTQLFQLPVFGQASPLPPAAAASQQVLAPSAAGGLPQIQQFSSQVAPAHPTPNLVPVPVSTHPPYAQMITEAIKALKDKDGSSKRAIGKYIERVYSSSNLPGTHSVLLTNHLKRLKEQGLIVMVKHSYKLPSSGRSPSPPVGPSSPTPNPISNGPKRPRGRPPKAKNDVTASSLSPPAQPAQAAASVNPAIPVPVHIHGPPINPGPNTDPVSVFASLGLADAPVPVSVGASSPTGKRRPGRPRKAESGGSPAATASALQPMAALGKKNPGRPRKVAAKNAINAAVDAAGLAGSIVVIPRGQPKLKKDGTPAKPRGRPPKKNLPVPTTNDSAPVAASGFLAPAVYVGEGALATAAAGAPAAKRRGRPPTKAIVKFLNGPKKPRKLSGKPLGRPKKFGSPTSVQQGGHAYEEMKRKLELFQSRIKQTVSIVKPCLDNTTNAASALNALTELEELANGGVGTVATVHGEQPQ